ncbi:TPA: hypothetical protein DEQ22_00510 [Candidatus Nomurabacteria bacterium]|uniref:Ada DNA repair metal-binding domain-containing protein n=2 Tax=Candidatus Nomuraibacteriota TaxID=1752729 RepID=A0A1F6YM36_9BACT|nr:MAG: hypothetical protein UV13_C0001G0054 [Parcubacteria group bacterium GW2011_GWC1_42_21]KKS58709.1 MAG: hypothetical protein UV23_C0002G0034 [Candidatus Nomurabacteria bacterium GW2011_GWF1_42_40]KKT00726.1 MAG: hypothetical protein UV77_C0001G0097 [Candidatus Nomurabacteria bacterium GW2011_GWA1_43_17]KKT07924.1 MAG: hypothetical protein UV85_C0003G0049 [Candidatus Nomurabacteria bacterium GW2011_GWB1_43_19]KKT11885.1 MAG: hypothetical protein UV91_C0001G0097 [Candidatus Nomurabacteria b
MQKIKRFWESEKGKDILIVIIVILVGLGSFELGRLSKESAQGGLKIEYPGLNGAQEANVISTAAPAERFGKNFFASNRGTKYYSIGCSGGKTIKEENRVWFWTGEEAEEAGYALSASCQ